MEGFSRRNFLAGAGIAAAACAAQPLFAMVPKSPFKIGVISDEISPDFDHACSVISKDFGLQWVELRSMWGKSMHTLSEAQLADAEKILAKYSLRVTDMGSPLFKVDWPDAPKSSFSPKHDFGANDSFKQQGELLDKYMALAKRFKTDKIRCFDFWRLDDVKPYRAAIDDKLKEAAETCGKNGLLLVIENEFECNTATAPEAARTLAAVPSRHFGLNWDPGNAVMRGELDAFPNGWNLLPKHRILHCHVKNAVKGPDGKIAWSPVDKGFIDWTAQFRDLKNIGYHGAVSLETHWHGAATHEESTRISWAGMKKALENSGTL
ncbi:MAG TPA: sugar phosphate isomerase/epimerase family protein [Edaphobacter sp.]|uniref:sugar phosphate isomerase/epimerase family protein n=1 Tax=Edaphobacter sp. TaxID=1934404 RepID=UPI002C3BFBA3|nr:sugar phosphate isomerase/epimerase family protein [Edaphobacter sp.]HUZ95767.1 sugar phosphate isomerase/epimerase family protein [Edaphobacter sp.]